MSLVDKYLPEAKLSEKEWESRMDKIDSKYKKLFRNVIKLIIKNKDQYYNYNSFEDIADDAAANVGTKRVGDEFTTRFLKTYELSIESFLSTAKELLDVANRRL